jgi:hypothetical protein
MIPKSGYRLSEEIMIEQIEHDPEKACPGLDPGWIPVFGKDHARIV